MIKRCLYTLGTLVLSLPLAAAPYETLQHQWEQCQYRQPERKQEACLAGLYENLNPQPESAEETLWQGIITSSYAGAKGGLGALKLVEQARTQLQRVIDQAPATLDGSAYTSLGALYYQVPGWPLSFGDDDKAEALLKQALTLNPDGIDPNYFYADFLHRQGRDREARQYLKRALNAPDRPSRPIADAGRRAEAQALGHKL